jgi:hypothetical protein
MMNTIPLERTSRQKERIQKKGKQRKQKGRNIDRIMGIDCMDYKVRHNDTHKVERKDVNKE